MVDYVETKRVAVRGAALELVGFGATALLRLTSTLILSRLLFPEAFGLSALVAIFIQGLTMLSDAGVEQSVVQNRRGDDPAFLNSAWMINVIRGVGLWLIACLGAWPMSIIYGDNYLLYLLPVGGLVLIINGMASTSLLTLRRQLRIAPLIKIELMSHAISLVSIVIWAYFHPTVWALVAAGIIGATVKTTASFLVDVGYRNRLRWDHEAGRAIFHFGKWIFGSSSLSFIARQGDRLLIGHFAGVGTLGIYSMAVFISDAAGMAVGRINSGILYPVLSRIAREDPDRLRHAFYEARLRTDLLGLVPLGGLMLMAEPLIDVLYDERYIAAGWMLQAMCIRVAMGIVVESIQNCLFSLGYTHYGFYQNLVRSVWIIGGIPIGWSIWGLEGVVWVTALSEIPVILMVWTAFWRIRLLQPGRELLSWGIFGIGATLGVAGKAVLAITLAYVGMNV